MNVNKTVDSDAAPNPRNLIQQERSSAVFNPDLMNYFLEGSKERSEETKKMIQQMERDPILASRSNYYDLTKAEQRELTIKKINRLSRYIESETFDEFERRMSLISVFDPQLHTRIGVHLGLFIGCVRSNGTFAQVNYWALEKESAFIKNIYGCFGMTELAHGSNVAGLQTTATFDEENDSFIINTPHIGATKWWIGGAAHSATHCSVYARLIVKGKDYGVKTFIVPLRDSNHDLMPGITIGDIGAKMGRDGIDNGWIQFSNVKIPRFFMLQKYAKVDSDGNVTLPKMNQLSYGALLSGRVIMVKDAFRWSSRFITIATRYGVGRRQFQAANAKENDEESQLLDYPLHQRRLIPILALCYAFSNGANVLADSAKEANDILESAVSNDDKAGIDHGIALTKSLFVASGSLKSTCTWLTLENIDKCRQACGGHGYSSYSGFGKAYNDFAVQCTWEGDNNILGMSVGKQLVKNIENVLNKGEKLSGILEFLNDSSKYLNKEVVLNIDDLNSTEKILVALQVAIIRGSAQCLKTLQAQNDNWDYIGADLVTLSKLLAHFFLLKAFLDKVKTMGEGDEKPLIPILDKLAKLYSYTAALETFSGNFLTYSVISPDAMTYLTTTRIQELCAELRPHVIPLTDSFQLSDMMINSAIGGYEGNFYEEYFKIVNTNNPPENDKAPYNHLIMKMLHRGSYDDRTRQEFSDEVAELIDPELEDS
ncbi:acyl-coenzyme A oxidase [[Candida] jaroonii]|uniref:Acyl-coenzyme A oxidase n=1 Tax=[Candida] jaroonii TaxID=467808 RepID=A0ACA9Y9X2_9ASCO|nr:acyl-coenzyme A oxidase [[Candida] jaroonii]